MMVTPGVSENEVLFSNVRDIEVYGLMVAGHSQQGHGTGVIAIFSDFRSIDHSDRAWVVEVLRGEAVLPNKVRAHETS